MKLSEISNLEQLAVEKRRLSSQVESRERRLEHSFEKASGSSVNDGDSTELSEENLNAERNRLILDKC